MKLAVLGSASSWYVADLQRAAGDRHVIVPAAFTHLASTVADSGASVRSGEMDLAACDVVLVRSMPPGSLEQVVFRMDALAQLATAGVKVVNSPRSLETAIDKYLSTVQLQRAGLATPRTIVCQTAEQAQAAFEELGGDVAVKPLFGGEGRGIARVSDAAIARRVFRSLEQIGAALYLQQFVPHEGHDLRLLVIGERVVGMRRRNDDDWRTNISLGGKAEPLEVNDELAEQAQRAAAAVGALLAGVDLLPGKDGKLYALEVNAVPGWKALARVTGVDVAAEVLDFISKRKGKG